jgi:hypothetical protein
MSILLLTVVVCCYPQNMVALVKLNVSTNNLYAAGASFFSKMIYNNEVVTELNLSNNSLLMGDAITILRAVEHNKSLVCIDLSYNQIFGDCTRDGTAALVTQMSKVKHVDIGLEGVIHSHAILQELQNSGAKKIKGLTSEHLRLTFKVDLPDVQYAAIHSSENKGIRIASQVPDNHDALSDLDFAAILQDMRQTEAAWWSALEGVHVQDAPVHANEGLAFSL